jgi:hypothetical protein
VVYLPIRENDACLGLRLKLFHRCRVQYVEGRPRASEQPVRATSRCETYVRPIAFVASVVMVVCAAVMRADILGTSADVELMCRECAGAGMIKEWPVETVVDGGDAFFGTRR